MASLFKVKALYDFDAKEEDDLGFPSGQIIDVTEEVDDNWLEGRYTDANGASHAGIFPREFVEKHEPEVPSRPSRPARPKQETAAASTTTDARASAPVTGAGDGDQGQDDMSSALPAAPKTSAAPISAPVALQQDQTSPPPTTSSQPPAAPKPAPAEPAPTGAKKAPPPVAVKSNAFRDRIAAFNQPAAAPIAPLQPGGSKPPGNSFIKKQFVAPPPSANAYVPPPKVESVHKPYIREEDPEIRQRQEEDRAAAEAAGFTVDDTSVAQQGEADEDAPKPQTLKERIARLQQQQMEQAQRRAEGSQKKEKKPPARKPTDPSEPEVHEHVDDEVPESADTGEYARRQSLDVARDRQRAPPTQRRPPEPSAPLPSAPEHEILSDGNEADQSAAGETTEDDAGTIGPDDDDDEKQTDLPRAHTGLTQEADVGDEEDTTEDGEDGEDEMDEETRRRFELRERMAKISGGMGMAGMFGPPGGMPIPGAAAKKKSTKEKSLSEDSMASSPPAPQQRIPIVPIPGMQRVQSPESDFTQHAEHEGELERDLEEDTENVRSKPAPRRSMTQERTVPPPPIPKESRPSQASPQEQDLPPPVPRTATAPRPPAPESRPVPPPPPAPGPLSPGPGSESDDEMSMFAKPSITDTSSIDTPGPLPVRTGTGGMAPRVPGSRDVPPLPPLSPEGKRSSYFGSEASPIATDKRASRPPPPVPGSPLASTRPPPPPPPAQGPPSRRATEDDGERGESEYEGDYDTDIASSAKHKDALKAHVREPSLDDSTTADEMSINSPPQPPQASAPRAVPPPPPSQAPAKARQSMDAPRAPPPAPPPRDMPTSAETDEYDPYRYESRGVPAPPIVTPAVPPVPAREPEQLQESSADDAYATLPPRASMDRPPPPPPHAQERPAPPPPSQAPPATRAPPRPSLDVHRSNTVQRRSMDQPRPSGEHDQIAYDIDLPVNTPWWTASQPLPPSLQSRVGVDILTESEESTSSKRGGRTTISKDIYVLYMDYSQTIITARYDSREPSDVVLEQRHEPPPPKLRQDQLENAWQRFGRQLADAAASHGHSKKDSVVGDGSPVSLVAELVKAQPDALQPVGTRAYGALVYANLANASTMQFDEIRPGDIITVRNAKFEGHHGAMKTRYKQEYGVNHVAIVEEWDGTKRAIRAWEQGREKKGGVRSEKFRLGDLRSGEVRVWRVVGREWVNWDGGS